MRLLILCVCALYPLLHVPAAAAQEVQRIEKGNLVIENVPEIPASLSDRLQQYQNTRSSSFGGWLSGEEGILITTRFGETNQIHHVRMPGGARTQLTFFDEPAVAPAPCPNATQAGFLFRMDAGGSENYQIYYYDTRSGASTMLSDGESRNGAALWSNLGDRYAFHSTRRNGRDYDIYIGSLGTAVEPELVLQTNGYWFPLDWSPDDTKLLLGQYISINQSYIYILDLVTKQLGQFNPNDEIIAYGGAKWSKDGKGVYFTSDQDSEFQELRYYDFEMKSYTGLSPYVDWDVDLFDLSPDGAYLAFTSNEDGISKLRMMRTETREFAEFDSIPVGVISDLDFSPDGKRIALTINSPQSPGDIYTLDYEVNVLTRWTASETGGLNADRFVSPQLVRFNTFDTVEDAPRTIPAFVYKPSGGGGAKFPVLVYIHGGPESQFHPTFNPFFQFYVNELGMAVIAPNVRGSAGYGKSYLKLDNGMNREDSVRDIGALLDWIAAQPDLDAARVVVMGGSYGGYMVLASMVHYNDRLRAGIDIVGISSFVTFLENTEEYRRDLRRAEYGDERVPEMREFLTKISPLTNAGSITRPMLIAQGLNDPRVPAGESEQIVQAIRNNGGEAWYILAKDEGHGFQKKSNRDFYYEAVAMFLEKVTQSNE